MAIPTTHRAVTVKGGNPKTLIITEKPIPTPGDEEILIKVQAVTLNPTDFKHVWNYNILQDGDSIGCDFAGDVVAVGRNVQGWKVGDAAAGFTRGGVIPDKNNGSFQEHVVAYSKSAWHIPTDELSYEDAAAMGGIALSTAAMALFNRLKLPTPWEPAKEPLPVLIWAGATSVGIFAIRLAKLAGLRVATTASPKNHELLKQIGAEVVFDYKDPEAPKKIKEWSEGKIRHGFDTISEHGSPFLAAEAFGESGGTLITLLPVQRPESGALAAKVEPIRIYVYDGLDKKEVEAHARMNLWYEKLPSFAAQAKVMPLKHWEGGLDAIPEALEYLRAGKTSAQKISLTI